MTAQLVARCTFPLVVVAAVYVPALLLDGAAQVIAVTVLAVGAYVLWLLNELRGYVDTAWKPLAQQSIANTQVAALYAKESAEFSSACLGELARYDKDAATIMAGRLRDLSARYEELLQ